MGLGRARREDQTPGCLGRRTGGEGEASRAPEEVCLRCYWLRRDGGGRGDAEEGGERHRQRTGRNRRCAGANREGRQKHHRELEINEHEEGDRSPVAEPRRATMARWESTAAAPRCYLKFARRCSRDGVGVHPARAPWRRGSSRSRRWSRRAPRAHRAAPLPGSSRAGATSPCHGWGPGPRRAAPGGGSAPPWWGASATSPNCAPP